MRLAERTETGSVSVVPGIILRLDPTLGSLQLALQLAVLVLKVADLLPHLRGTGDLLLEGEQLDGMSAVLAMPGGLDAPESV